MPWSLRISHAGWKGGVVELILARASDNDAADIANIMTVARESAMPYLVRLYTAEEVRAWVSDTLLKQDEVWVARSGSAIVGFAAIAIEFLDHLYVLPEYQGKGAGSALLEQVKLERPEGFKLFVFQKNSAARSFYERKGLRLLKLSDGSNNEEKEPDALYIWDGSYIRI
jgi:GNAT superfamily N-acetyltransferase